MNTLIDWVRVNNDGNGNPRYVAHFTDLLSDETREKITGISKQYGAVLNEARKLGGKKYHNKQYGGGIVFQSYNIQSEEKQIIRALGLSKKYGIPAKEYRDLDNLRRIQVEFNGYKRDGSGPFVKFSDDYVTHDERIKTKVVYFENRPSEELPEFALRKLAKAGFNVVAKCTGKHSFSFLCDNWSEDFVNVSDIK